MCGIAGFVATLDGAGDLYYHARAMADAIGYRGPDDSGIWTEPESGVALSHRRLSILDLSPAGHQPMVSVSGRYVVTFNGEIYNFRPLREELERAGFAFRGHSDTEILLAAIEQWGVQQAVKRFVGMFAFALWDRRERVLHLARDRVGEKPLYYGWQGSVFLFGSELKALSAHPAWQADIDRGALALFLRHNYVPAPYSIYQGIYKLLPGCVLSLSMHQIISYTGFSPFPDTSALTPTPYWSAREVAEKGIADPFRGTEDEAVQAVDDLLRTAVRQQMVADVPLGAFLSGGIDSSAVVALMQAESSQPVRTFTIGFHEPSYNEAEHGKAVARHLGTDHTELYVTPAEAMNVIPKLPELYDEPFADSSQIPTFLVAQLARRSVTVALSGDAGDELFGGYTRYFWARTIWRSIAWLPPALRRTTARTIRSISPETWDGIYGSLAPMLPKRFNQHLPGDRLHKLARLLSLKSSDALYLRLVSHWAEPERVVREAQLPPMMLTQRARWPERLDFMQRMFWWDLVTYLPDDLLVKVDRAAMGVSLETRIPMLDHRVIEFAWRLPTVMKVRHGQGKRILRRVLYRYVPKELIERPKMGFGIPVGSWLRGPLREWAEDLLAPARLGQEGFFDPAPIREKWAQHLSGGMDWSYLLWDVLMFQAWLVHTRGQHRVNV